MLILGTDIDPHVKAVSEKLTDKGHDVKLLDHNAVQNIKLISDKKHYLLSIDNDIINARLIWYRVKLFPPTDLKNDTDAEKQNFGQIKTIWEPEWLALYRAIALESNARVVNDRMAVAQYASKINQRSTAHQVGFKTPAALITTNKADSINFFNRYPNIITKAINNTTSVPATDTEGEHVVMTSRVELEILNQADESSFTFCPTFFQQEVPKKLELRVVVIGQHCLAFSIDSQKHSFTQVDWRFGNSMSELFELYALSHEVEEKLFKFLELTGLFYGSFDLIIDPDDQVWFLECNPDGQWMWLDKIVEGKISDCFADEFANLLNKS